MTGAIEFEEADLSSLPEPTVATDNELVSIEKPRKELPGTQCYTHAFQRCCVSLWALRRIENIFTKNMDVRYHDCSRSTVGLHFNLLPRMPDVDACI